MLSKLMDNVFENIIISLPELNYYKSLDPTDKVEYFLDLYDISKKSINYSSEDLAKGVQNFFDELEADESTPELESYDVGSINGTDRVDVLVDNENLVLESNSLKATREIRNRFLDCGYLLSRDLEVEDMLKPDKITRFLRVYKIIGRTYHLCYN